jgi:hypothetical protein
MLDVLLDLALECRRSLGECTLLDLGVPLKRIGVNSPDVVAGSILVHGLEETGGEGVCKTKNEQPSEQVGKGKG